MKMYLMLDLLTPISSDDVEGRISCKIKAGLKFLSKEKMLYPASCEMSHSSCRLNPITGHEAWKNLSYLAHSNYAGSHQFTHVMYLPTIYIQCI